MIRILLELFYAEEAFYCVCFGPLGLAILLIVGYYVVWWWLKTRSSVQPELIQRYRVLAGRGCEPENTRPPWMSLYLLSLLGCPVCPVMAPMVIA
jgi:hypothetical protein